MYLGTPQLGRYVQKASLPDITVQGASSLSGDPKTARHFSDKNETSPRLPADSWASSLLGNGTIATSPTSAVPLPSNAFFKSARLEPGQCAHICAGTATPLPARTSKPAPDSVTWLQHLSVTTCQHVSLTHASAPTRQRVSVTPHQHISVTTRIVSVYGVLGLRNCSEPVPELAPGSRTWSLRGNSLRKLGPKPTPELAPEPALELTPNCSRTCSEPAPELAPECPRNLLRTTPKSCCIWHKQFNTFDNGLMYFTL